MKKYLLFILLLLPLYTFGQMAPGEEFTGEFRPNPDCEFEWEGYTNFNRWKCLIPVDRPLPITLISFKAVLALPGTVKVNWQYEILPGHEFFILQHSKDAKTWQKLSTQVGNTYTHRTNLTENYYRLLSVDTDGTVNIYSTIYVKNKQEPVRYFDLMGREVVNPKPYQLVIGNGKKLMIVK